MPTPVISSIFPAAGPASGGELVRLTGNAFAARVAVSFGDTPAVTVGVHQQEGLSIADVRPAPHEPGLVDVVVQNLDANGNPVPGERAVVGAAYRYLRAQIAPESDLTRLVRQLMRELKKQVLVNVSASVSVDYDDTSADGSNVIAIAAVPSIVLTGPTVRENRFYSVNVLDEDIIQGASGPEFARRSPPFTVDLVFGIVGTSARTAELFNLVSAVATFLNRNRRIEMARDPSALTSEVVGWDMVPDGQLQTQLGGRDDVRTFTWGLVIRGFDIDEGLTVDRGKAVAESSIDTTAIPRSAP